MHLIIKVINKLKSIILKILNKRNFDAKIKSTFSSNLIDLLNYSFNLKISKTDHELIFQIEDLRLVTRQNIRMRRL